jgi:hypothetical protein
MSKKALVTVVDVYECPKGMKCLYLENLSTTKVHGHIGPDDGRHVEGLQETRQVEMLRLVALACCTCPYEVLNHHLHAGNMKVKTQLLQCLGYALMAVQPQGWPVGKVKVYGT